MRITNKKNEGLLGFDFAEAVMREFAKFLENGASEREKDDMILSFRPEMVNTLTAAMYSGRCMIDGTSGEVKATPDEELAYSMETCGCAQVDREDETYAVCPVLTKSPECVGRYLTAFLEHFGGVAS